MEFPKEIRLRFFFFGNFLKIFLRNSQTSRENFDNTSGTYVAVLEGMSQKILKDF